MQAWKLVNNISHWGGNSLPSGKEVSASRGKKNKYIPCKNRKDGAKWEKFKLIKEAEGISKEGEGISKKAECISEEAEGIFKEDNANQSSINPNQAGGANLPHRFSNAYSSGTESRINLKPGCKFEFICCLEV